MVVSTPGPLCAALGYALLPDGHDSQPSARAAVSGSSTNGNPWRRRWNIPEHHLDGKAGIAATPGGMASVGMVSNLKVCFVFAVGVSIGVGAARFAIEARTSGVIVCQFETPSKGGSMAESLHRITVDT